MKTLVALVSGLGWHVADLHRAAGRLEVALHAIPFSEVSASVELDRGGTVDSGWRPRSAEHGWRAGSDDAAREPGAGGFPDGRAAPSGGVGRAGAQSPTGRRGGRR